MQALSSTDRQLIFDRNLHFGHIIKSRYNHLTTFIEPIQSILFTFSSTLRKAVLKEISLIFNDF